MCSTSRGNKRSLPIAIALVFTAMDAVFLDHDLVSRISLRVMCIIAALLFLLLGLWQLAESLRIMNAY